MVVLVMSDDDVLADGGKGGAADAEEAEAFSVLALFFVEDKDKCRSPLLAARPRVADIIDLLLA